MIRSLNWKWNNLINIWITQSLKSSTYTHAMSQLLAYAIEVIIVIADYVLGEGLVAAVGVVQREFRGRALDERSQICRWFLAVSQGPQEVANEGKWDRLSKISDKFAVLDLLPVPLVDVFDVVEDQFHFAALQSLGHGDITVRVVDLCHVAGILNF